MEPSQKAYDLVQHFEGLRLKSYKDSGGLWTIGYGHTSRVYGGMIIDEEEAYQMLIDDMDEHAYELNRMLMVDVLQHQFDALLSWVFNLGSDATRKSTLIRKLNEGKSKVSQEFLRWDKVRDPKTGVLKPSLGLSKRRRCEKHLFDTGELVFE